MAFPGEKYPLNLDEENAIIASMFTSESILLVIGVVGSIVACGITTGDWAGATIGFGWARSIAQSCMALSALDTAIATAITTAAVLAFSRVAEFIACQTETGLANIVWNRQGINGEIPRIGTYSLFAGMLAAGFAEELLFRFVLVGGLSGVLSLFVPSYAAMGIAIVASTVLFWFAHEEYRDPYTISVTIGISLLLAAAFVITGSYLVVAIAHAAYDIIDVEIEGSRMIAEDDYFGGEPPQSVLLDIYEEMWREKDDRANRDR